MNEAEWLVCDEAGKMLEQATLSVRKARLFAVACCRCSRQLMLNGEHRAAVDLAERFADGEVHELELSAAYQRTDEYALARRDARSEREIRRWYEAVAVLNVTNPLSLGAWDAVWNLNRAAGNQATESIHKWPHCFATSWAIRFGR